MLGPNRHDNLWRSPRTSNAYLTAIKGFSKWLVRDRRASEDVLLHMSHLNTKVDLRRQRRTLTADETARLIAAAASGEEYRGLSGPDRAALYQVALNTGLRVGELASLTAQSFDLDSEPPTVAVEAAYSKHRRRDVLPIRADLAAVVRDYLRRRKPTNGERLWCGTWSDWGAAKMIKADLASAKKAMDQRGQDGRGAGTPQGVGFSGIPR